MATLEDTTEGLSPQPRSSAASSAGSARDAHSAPGLRVAPEWHVPLCVAASLVAHAALVTFAPHGVSHAQAPERELVFMDIEELLSPELPEPEPEPEIPEPEVPEPPPAVVPLARRDTPPPAAPVDPTPEPVAPEPETAPPPAAAPVMAATNPGAGAPVFTAGAAGGSAHGLGSTVREGETNPNAARATPAPPPTADFRRLMSRYVQQLRGRVSPGVMYPPSARVANLAGTVRLGLLIDENGNVTGRRITRSSGHSSLDQAVLAAASRINSVPAPPAELRAVWRGPQELTLTFDMAP
ncbi:MAG: energy transducer TonB [Polyangiales bacterium]|nr:energy transducer TonB [Myxococcales bacterium]MCB9657165.1 energy transducer TonB [Sandaracinaceae bacterium]